MAQAHIAAKRLYSQPYRSWIMALRAPFHLIYRKLLTRFYCSLQLSNDRVAKLPDKNRHATLEMRRLVGRKSHAFSMATSTQSVFKALEWQPGPNDVIVITAPKSGTTWLQHMLHLIKTGGDDVTFDDIYEVAPWIDFAWELGQELNADQRGNIRIFKSHGVLSRVHEGCKYVCVIRDPLKMLKSLYTFFLAKAENMTEMTSRTKQMVADVNTFYQSPVWTAGMSFSGGDSFFKHFVEFYKCRQCPTVSLLIFEDIQADLRGTIEQMCDFMDVPRSTTLVEKVAERASLEWMTAHSTKFDDHMIYDRQVSLGRWGYGRMAPASKVNLRLMSEEGKRKAEPSDETIQGLRADWKRLVTPETGFETYEEMVDALRKERAAGAFEGS